SGSMLCPAADDTCQTALPGGTPPSRWEAMGTALNGFVNSPAPAMAGVGVGIGFFGVGNASCTVNDYATPVVPIAPLPGNAGPIGMAIAMNMPSGGTPTAPALTGA